MARISCTLGDILTGVKTRLVDVGVFTSAQCFIGIAPDEAMTMAAPPASPLGILSFIAMNQMDTLSCESDNSDEPTIQGVLTIACWIRLPLDKVGVDTYLVTKADLGESDMIRKIVSALNNVSILNSDGDELTWRTLTYMGFNNRGKWSKDPEWARLDVRFDMTFSQKVLPDGDVLIYSDMGTLEYETGDDLVWS